MEFRNGATIYLGYDHTGERTYKKRVRKNSQQIRSVNYFFPFKGLDITVIDNKVQEESYSFVGDRRIARLEHSTGKLFYYLKDHLDSSDILMSLEGIPVEQMNYRSYGNELPPRMTSKEWRTYLRDHKEFKAKNRTHHRFTGYYKDDEGGLYYAHARYYDPKLGRFITADPLFLEKPEKCILSPIECSIYLYAKNNPISFVDPTGQWGFFISTSAVLGIAESPKSFNGRVVESSSGVAFGTEKKEFTANGFVLSGDGESIAGGVAGAGLNLGLVSNDISSISGPGKDHSYVIGPLGFTATRDSRNNLVSFSISVGGKGIGLAEYYAKAETTLGPDITTHLKNHIDDGFKGQERENSSNQNTIKSKLNEAFKTR